MAAQSNPGFDTRRPPPWLYGDTWEERAAIVISGFAAMPDPGAVTGYAQMCPDIKHAPEDIKAKVRAAYSARIAELEKLSPPERKKIA
jgi:hypothetical protein